MDHPCTRIVWMYEIDNGIAVERQKLSSPPGERESLYGMSLSMLDETLYVGEPWSRRSEGQVRDAVHVYRLHEGGWELSDTIVREYDGAVVEPVFGAWCHALQNGSVAIGAVEGYSRKRDAPDPGCVFLYQRSR